MDRFVEIVAWLTIVYFVLFVVGSITGKLISTLDDDEF